MTNETSLVDELLELAELLADRYAERISNQVDAESAYQHRRDLLENIQKKLGMTVAEMAAEIRTSEVRIYRALRGKYPLSKTAQEALVDLGKKGPRLNIPLSEVQMRTWPEVQQAIFKRSEPKTIFIFTLRPLPLQANELMRRSFLEAFLNRPFKLVYVFPQSGMAKSSYQWWAKVLASECSDCKGGVYGLHADSGESGESIAGDGLLAFEYALRTMICQFKVDSPEESEWVGYAMVPINRHAQDVLSRTTRPDRHPRFLWSQLDEDTIEELRADIITLRSNFKSGAFDPVPMNDFTTMEFFTGQFHEGNLTLVDPQMSTIRPSGQIGDRT